VGSLFTRFYSEVDLGKTLCIPSIFISYTGEALDKKLPLLRSDMAVSKAAVNLLKILGHNAKQVFSTCGPEQEYFLIDEMYNRLRTICSSPGERLSARRPRKASSSRISISVRSKSASSIT